MAAMKKAAASAAAVLVVLLAAAAAAAAASVVRTSDNAFDAPPLGIYRTAELTECVTGCGSQVAPCMLDCYGGGGDGGAAADPLRLPGCLLGCTNDAMSCATGCSGDTI